jgi:hypothetical protein
MYCNKFQDRLGNLHIWLALSNIVIVIPRLPNIVVAVKSWTVCKVFSYFRSIKIISILQLSFSYAVYIHYYDGLLSLARSSTH